MVFWIIIAGVALGVGVILGVTLLRGRVGDAPPAAYDLQVYRDQLREVDRDLARGVIGAQDAERVRAEVSRRVLAADAQLQAGGETGGQPHVATWLLAGAMAIIVAGGSVWLYSNVGTPGYADLPLKKRISTSDTARANRLTQVEVEARAPAATANPNASAEFLDLMKKLRKTVADRPDDLNGLTLLARNEAALGNLTAAHVAQQQVIKVKGPKATADDYAVLADLQISAASGYVSVEAETALRAALQRDPHHPAAQYYLGLYLLQVDRPDGAFRIWEKLLRDSPPDAPWVAPIRSQLEEVAWRAGVKYTLPPGEEMTGPSTGDVEAAQDMSAEDRNEMIRGMVTQLSDRLATEGGTPAEWARLIGAYGVLGDTERAHAIWDEAQQVFADKPEALSQVRAGAERAGILTGIAE